MESKEPIKGAEFLIRESDCSEIYTPEDYNEEQRMIAQTCLDFIRQEIEPDLDRIDAMEDGLMQSKMEKAGELGMLGMSVPMELGGMGVDFPTSLLATEYLGRGNSFSVAYGAHTGIGTLPILYYGNDAQKEKYIPKLASGEWKAAYCLTEPSSGSDANSGKTKAKLTDDGKHYVINGQKMWITNGGFANVFTVFAKIDDDDKLTGFIVACSKVRPDGITSLKSKSVLKNLRKKSFAASVDRDEIYLGHNLIGIELSDHVDFIIEILKENSKILELKT